MTTQRTTMAQRAKAMLEHRPEYPSWLIAGTGPTSDCTYSISGTHYTVALMRDGSALAWLNRGRVYACLDRAGHDTLGTLARVGRLLTELDEPTRVRQTLEIGTLVARSAGVEWYRIGPTVWCVRSATQCDYCGLTSEWIVPEHAEAA